MDRRGLVFLGFALVSFALFPIADEHDGSNTWQWGKDGWSWVPLALGVVYTVLALLSWLDHRHKEQIGARPLGYDRDEGHVPGIERRL